MNRYDAVLVPGGGLREDGAVPPWVENRLERALELAGADTPILTLSAGTTYKPVLRDADGWPIFESVAGAQWLAEHGHPAQLLFTETASYDTIGNAYFARMIHTDPAGWRRLAVITSAFHMARTEAIFRWIFSLAPCPAPHTLSFTAVPDVGIAPDALAARREKEAAGLGSFAKLERQHRTLAAVHLWLFSEHQAYAIHTAGEETGQLDARVAESY